MFQYLILVCPHCFVKCQARLSYGHFLNFPKFDIFLWTPYKICFKRGQNFGLLLQKLTKLWALAQNMAQPPPETSSHIKLCASRQLIRNGQNIKLVSKITGYTVDAMSKDQYEGNDKADNEDDSLDFLSSKIKDILSENNINTIEDLIANRDNISDLKGIGPKTLEKIKEKISENEQA